MLLPYHSMSIELRLQEHHPHALAVQGARLLAVPGLAALVAPQRDGLKSSPCLSAAPGIENSLGLRRTLYNWPCKRSVGKNLKLVALKVCMGTAVFENNLISAAPCIAP